MKEAITTALEKLGFHIADSANTYIIAYAESFNNGRFELNVSLKNRCFSVKLHERFSCMNIFFHQAFENADTITELLLNNFAFNEFIVDNDGCVEAAFKEWRLRDEL